MMAAMRTASLPSLGELLAGLADCGSDAGVPIRGLSLDSRRVRGGDLFLACAGTRGHGADFIDQALAAGAAAVAVEAVPGRPLPTGPLMHAGRRVPLLAVDALSAYAGPIAARFYGNPSTALRVVGVTGTNGKTSVSHYVAHALAADAPSAVVGTLGSGLVGELTETGHTTPDAVSVQRELARLRDAGARSVAMEVSSHALDQGRVNGVRIEVAVFTNLSHDHLDYHPDLKAYAEAKRRLLAVRGLRQAVINLDDPEGRRWLAAVPAAVQAVGYGFVAEGPQPMLAGRDLRLSGSGLEFTVDSPWGTGPLRSPLLGRFNAANLLAALGALLALEVPFDEALGRLGRVPAVPGRMERFGGGRRPLAVVDYAHTPDALEQVLQALRAHCRGRLSCVFGCGGDRDAAKRPLMGAVAERLADRVVVTDDNPRGEPPERIVAAILAGMQRPQAVRVQHDRAAAIAEALGDAGEGDIVLVAGKGHEEEQIIGARRRPFSDRAVVRGLLGEERDD